MSDCRLSIRITDQLKQDLGAVAESQGKSESDVVRQALEEYCAKSQRPVTAYDLAVASGLIGCAGPGLPSDLSTNKKHFEGFGRD